ncbi:MAG: hypothetical protein V1819_00930 [bacterium]
MKIENSIFNFTGIGRTAQNIGLGSSYFAFVHPHTNVFGVGV